jgi:hypothetical protein
MERPLDDIAPRFVDLAHGTGIAVAAAVGADGRDRTRVVRTWRAGR